MKKKALLVVSFGTAYAETRKKTIEAVEEELQEVFSEYAFYRAWTSGFLIKKVKKEQGLEIDGLAEALQRMKADGMEEVLIQPTYIMQGVEYERTMSCIEDFVKDFPEIRVGTPLLSTKADEVYMVDALLDVFQDIKADELLVFMGHGSPEGKNDCYHEINRLFAEKGYGNFRMGLVEAEPGIEAIIEEMEGANPSQVYLTPFTLVAGNHALKDMSGDGDDTWQHQLERAGYKVFCKIQGLGEYEEVRKLFEHHAKEAATWRKV